MPKVPEYVASQGVPGSAPFEHASPVGFGAPAALAAEKGFKEMEAVGLLAQRHIQYIEAEEARQRIASKVLGHINNATEQATDIQTKMRQGYKDAVTGEWVPPVSSENFVNEFSLQYKKMHEGLLSSVQDEPIVQGALDKGLKRLYESQLIEATHFSRALHVQEQQGDDIVQADKSAQLAATAARPEEREARKNQYLTELDVKYGDSQPKYVEKLKRDYQIKVDTAYMQHKLETDPMDFAIRNDKGEFNNVPYAARSHLLNQYNTKVKAEQERQKELWKDNKKLYDQRFFADLNSGKVPWEEMEKIRNGTHDWYTSQEYPHLLNLWNSPPDGRGNKEVAALRDQYLGNLTSIPTLQYIQHYRDETNKLSKAIGVQNKGVTAFLEELKHDMVTATAGNTRETNNELKKFEAGLKSTKESTIGMSFYDHMIRGQLENADGMGRGMILGGGGKVTAEQALKAVREQYDSVIKKRAETPIGKLDKIRIDP